MKKRNRDSNAATVNMVLYILLLIATPFLLVRNYLQQAIGMFSQWSYEVGGIRLPYVLTAVVLFLVILAVINWRQLRLKHLLYLSTAIILMGIGQSSTDYYFHHDFYELQHNWHYFAYGLFAWVAWLYHQARGSTRLRYIWQTFGLAVFISVLDETAQIFISSRVFDICDNGKDIWGVVVGMLIVLLFTRPSAEKMRLLHRQPLANLHHPWSVIFILLIFSLLFLSIASILTEVRYITSALLWTFGIFLPVITAIWLLQFKAGRLAVLALIGILVTFGAITISRNKTNIIIQKEAGRLSWRGISLPWFDLMLHTDGTPRLVDKKLYFNKKDKINRIYGLCGDILLIGSGTQGQGGKGFSTEKSHFVYNPILQKPLQILVYPNLQACKIYNQLRAEGKEVLFIIHNG